MSASLPIALLGTGLLGTAIGQRLLQQGLTLRVWNRHPERLQPLVALGAEACATAAEAVLPSRWVITALSDGGACRQVLLPADDLRWQGQRVLQMGTIAPDASRQLAEALPQRGAAYLEAPVLGSRPEALAGTLQILVGGDEDLYREALPLLRHLGPQPKWFGAVGSALETKLALNQLIASLTHAFSLSLHLVQAAGVDVEQFMAVLRGSALHAPTFDKKLPRLLADDFTHPNFPTAHLRKDLQLFLAAARQHGLDTTGLAGLELLLDQARGTPLDRLDYSALHRLTGPAPPPPAPSAGPRNA
ncbi:NAD(P)-dependent oxidoreductase [Cyanobium sp. NIES-981]|uniref:NAD(P)-dependent oxidoreductase n=1 Tax=Cyanobium sp. NIES-981 TaxID=1851505 RepID=UPI0007DDA799|nr:NAD(P)-dependent oxidoreductase [Cyanobium sp. NIES-981]SBO44507.1 2-hydroxy-3-oxopropionate reductase [Cyanobium sp. NIES-981]